MCFIQVGHFNKNEKKVKKTSTPITGGQMKAFYKILIEETGIGKTLNMINFTNGLNMNKQNLMHIKMKKRI